MSSIENDGILVFDVEGPREVPFHYGTRGRRLITSDDGAQFFADNEDIGERRGCYVFGLRSGGGITPWYVGKTLAYFDGECFQSHKLMKYNEALFSAGKGTPVLLFVVYPPAKGPPNHWAVDELESYLIQSAFRRNPALLNKTKRGEQYWGIRGVTLTARGKPSNAARNLSQALWLG